MLLISEIPWLLLSRNGLISLFILALLYYILQDYPEWRLQQKQKQLQHSDAKHDTAHTTHATQPSTTPSNDDNPKNLSWFQYIMAMPLATVYIIVRGLFDIMRNTIFWTLWLGEKAAPKVDTWLFELVTERLPARIKQVETWWATRGSQQWHHFKHTVTHRLLPATVYYIEKGFFGIQSLYHTSKNLGTTMVETWRRISQQHDWKQLMHNVGTAIWYPVAWTVRPLMRIAIKVFDGSVRVGKSLWTDMRWLALEVVPLVWQICSNLTVVQVFWQSSNRVYETTFHALSFCLALLYPAVIWLQGKCVQCVDLAAEFIQSPLFQRWCTAVHRYLLSNTAWFAQEFYALADAMMWMLNICILYGVRPVVLWCIHTVWPQCTILYQRVVTILNPLWVVAYPVIHQLYMVAYTLFSMAISTSWDALSNTAAAWSAVVGRNLWRVSSVCATLATAITRHAAQYGAHIYWLCVATVQQHAPVLAELATKIYQAMADSVASIDWEHVIQVLQDVQLWIILQSDMLFKSLERTLDSWFTNQSGEPFTKSKIQ